MIHIQTPTPVELEAFAHENALDFIEAFQARQFDAAKASLDIADGIDKKLALTR